MIAYLCGRIEEVLGEILILNVQGVGYELHVPTPLLAEATLKRGHDIAFWVSTQVREDAITLFAFVNVSDRQMFLQLLKVNGVGPKMALNVLSHLKREEFVALIESENVSGLAKVPKVGRKTAEQMILTMKGKLVLADAGEVLPPIQKGAMAEVISALTHLGFRANDVEQAVGQIPEGTSFEESVRRGLALLAGAGGKS